MKKLTSILVAVLFSIGLVSCEAESTAEDQILYEVGTDDDDNPTQNRDSTDDDDNPTQNRDSTDDDDNPTQNRGGN
ncbi:MAG: hypothetical protein KJO94_01975 [Eudoraea sp.]|nr:hypothetical protein [Eudoraea sp.]